MADDKRSITDHFRNAKTFIAPLLGGIAPIFGPKKHPIYWLDQLFYGGLRRPAELQRPVVLLLCGPPGAGKSLLAQQICYSRARHNLEKDAKESWGRGVIVSAETPAPVIAENMKDLGFKSYLGQEPVYAGYEYKIDNRNPRRILIPIFPEKHPAMTILSPLRPNQPWTPDVLLDHVLGCWEKVRNGGPSIFVVDSLNVLAGGLERRKQSRRPAQGEQDVTNEHVEERQSLARVYDQLTSAFGRELAFLFLIVDTPGIGSAGPTIAHHYWEYVADIIIRVDYAEGEQGYFTRHLEVIKTRFQAHVLGKQVMKIFPGRQIADPEGARPKMDEGGLFIFPSEHYVLSSIRTGQPIIEIEAPHSDSVPQWPVEYCHELVGGGDVPRYQTTAIIGRRGLHKSYFAYQFLLDGIVRGEKTLTISFRDNEDGVGQTLGRIAKADIYNTSRPSNEHIKKFNKVIYQRPGYVTPQEFLHRVIAAVGEHHPSRVMVGSIDQWEASYPLLAKSHILLPALIDFLNAHGATSMIIGVEGTGRAVDWCGLTAKAEVVLSFDYQKLEWIKPPADAEHGNPELRRRPSQGYAVDGYKAGTQLIIPSEPMSPQPKVVIHAVRVPHGRAGLARAVLEYTYHEEAKEKEPAGLKLLPLAPEYPIGMPI